MYSDCTVNIISVECECTVTNVLLMLTIFVKACGDINTSWCYNWDSSLGLIKLNKYAAATLSHMPNKFTMNLKLHRSSCVA